MEKKITIKSLIDKITKLNKEIKTINSLIKQKPPILTYSCENCINCYYGDCK